MTDATLFSDEQFLVAGETDQGLRYVQFWGMEGLKELRRMTCLVEMTSKDVGGPIFAINAGCPEEWMQPAWDTFMAFENGVLPAPTHTIRFDYGKPTFTDVVSPEPSDLRDSNGSGDE